MNTIKTYEGTKENEIAKKTLTYCGTDTDGGDIYSDLGIKELWYAFCDENAEWDA